jgi:hypothetical protein
MFLQLNETVCQFGGISSASRVVESHLGENQVNDDVSELLMDAEQRLGMPNGSLEMNREFNVAIDDSGTPIQIYLVQFTATDAPQEQLAEQSGKFIALTEARRLLPTELELLRLAYSAIMDDLV